MAGYRKTLNELWGERKAGGQAAPDWLSFRKGRGAKGAAVAATESLEEEIRQERCLKYCPT